MPDFRHRLRFECTGCGECCTGRGDYYIEVTCAEQQRIQRFLGVSWRWFRRRYVFRYGDDLDSVCMARDGRCVFLRTDRRCRIYAVRPAQCRHYPFWPEVLSSHSAWQREGRRCEGINRGAVVPLERIRAALRRQGAR